MSDIQKIEIHRINENKDNPRTIKDDKFQKLIKSIKEFPEMLNLRPIVVNEEGTILGGNMRYRASVEAGLKEVPVIYAKDLTEEQQKEFVVKDNQGYGEWDWELLQTWDSELLSDAGFDDWDIIGITGNYERDGEYRGNIEGSNFKPDKVDVNDYIKQNIIWFNEFMVEVEDEELKEAISNVKEIGTKEEMINEIIEVVKRYGKNTV